MEAEDEMVEISSEEDIPCSPKHSTKRRRKRKKKAGRKRRQEEEEGRKKKAGFDFVESNLIP